MALLGLSLCGTAACGDLGGDAGVQARDSAGVRVVESLRPAWGGGEEGWRTGPTPLLDLSATGADPHRFQIISGAVRLRDGRVAVADGGDQTVRLFDPQGRPLAVYPGPGEAAVPQAISSLHRMAGDSLLAFDPSVPSLYLLSPDGELVRQIPLSAPSGIPLSVAFDLGDGTFLVRGGWSASMVRGARPGWVRTPLPFFRFSREGLLLDTVAVVPGDALALVQLGPAGAFVPPPLGPLTVSTVGRGRLFVGTGERFEISVYRRDGGLEGLFRIPDADLTVTPEERQAARGDWDEMGRQNPVARRLLAQIEDAVPVPATRPAYAALLLDAEGDLWVGDYPFGGRGAGTPRLSTRFSVLDPSGRLLGDVEMPDGLEPTDVGSDYVLGIARGGGAETVRIYHLERGAPPSR